ncbi:hypothetical protein DQP57_23625 [Mycobacterium colombiense]|uniref:Uncharacterized protein n=1 Tax=Mycobacterium colombiense TaxID=339268 RepID=A0A329LCD0_9MYCO|nr:hypothetical protein DQP57_23625 [Mycobacterium colombiense]
MRGAQASSFPASCEVLSDRRRFGDRCSGRSFIFRLEFRLKRFVVFMGGRIIEAVGLMLATHIAFTHRTLVAFKTRFLEPLQRLDRIPETTQARFHGGEALLHVRDLATHRLVLAPELLKSMADAGITHV